MSCLLILIVLRAQNFYMLRFSRTPNTLPTLSHIQNIVRYYLFERCVHFSDWCSKKLHFLKRENKQVPVNMFQKDPFLTAYIPGVDYLMTSQNANFEQDEKLCISRFPYAFILSVSFEKFGYGLVSEIKFTHKRFWDIWILIGYVIDTFRNTAPDIYRKVV